MLKYRKKAAPDENNTQPWLLTYSDMVTLCLTFFVLLYSFSTLDAFKWKSVVLSVQGALGPLDGGNSVLDGPPGLDPSGPEINNQTEPGNDANANDLDKMEEFLKYNQEMQKLEEVRAQLNAYMEGKGLTASVSLAMEERGLVLRFQDSVLFLKGRADLVPGSAEILENVAGVLNTIDNPVRIEGHTDDLPINTPRFPSNWELSTTRATNVLRFVIDRGLAGKRLSAVGYGEYHPLVPNSGEENRRKNRRVDIVIIRESLRVNEPN